MEGMETPHIPRVSILMGVYNAAAYLDEAIESLLAQSFENWELIAVDDASTDRSRELLVRWATRDRRIRAFANDLNLGLASTLNVAAEHARGEYLARQDADDRSTHDRLEKQIAFLDSDPAVAIVSAGMTLFDEHGPWGSVNNIAWPQARDFVAKSPFSHAASMLRREAFDAVGGYRDLPHTWRVEDYDLWFRLYEKGFRGHNIQRPLYEARDDRDASARRKFRYRWNETLVKVDGYRRLGLAPVYYPKALRPLAVGLVPPSIYRRIRRRRHASHPRVTA